MGSRGFVMHKQKPVDGSFYRLLVMVVVMIVVMIVMVVMIIMMIVMVVVVMIVMVIIVVPAVVVMIMIAVANDDRTMIADMFVIVAPATGEGPRRDQPIRQRATDRN